MISRKLMLAGLLVLSILFTAGGISSSSAFAGSEDLAALAPTQTPVAVAAAPEAVGPDQFPEGVNPLTGLQVQDPALLDLPPALVSVTNFPVSARPPAGLSFSPYVFEMYIGNGMTRYLALFYGEVPSLSASGTTGVTGENTGIGPVRSGRLPFESLRKLYNGALVTTGASAEVGAVLSESATVYGTDKNNINSALIDVSRLQKVAEASAKRLAGPLNLTGNRFDPAAPAGGKAAEKAWVFYNFYNQIEWLYDSAEGAYLRSQDQADGSGQFHATTDRLTGEHLAFENVVVLFAEHTAYRASLVDVNLLYTTRPALLFRDGQVYRIFWTTIGGEYEKQSGHLRPIRFVDAQGNPFPLKPGQTWVQVVTPATTALETSPGNWKIRFYAP